ncbi:MAG: hypothetical protein KJ043_06285, partial [Anaerolineae bacterium]|nr:hypothetical protein [Anaerolineae bacterium]
ENIKNLAQSTLAKMIERLIGVIDEEKLIIKPQSGLTPVTLKPELDNKKKETGRFYLPLRPLVSGGDDITFVCEGRIGIDLAVTFLDEFQKQSHGKTGHHLTACAGIAIVNTKYPFARAYDLAEELCSNAKKARRNNHIQGSAFDWHYTTGGLYDSLSEMRKREYQRNDGTPLHSRPIMLVNNAHFQTWEQLQANIQIFHGWHESRNKAKGLMDAIRKNDVDNFKTKYLFKKDGTTLPTPDGDALTYDALELMDLYIDLGAVKKAQENGGK